ncbi:MAG: tetratricopeptide repeat protein [Candidatus Thioglobus sp.]|nr:tetratricopeptide repeat protein [Candidatus Thioglobus sp.]
MKLFVYISIGLFALQIPTNAAEINTSKILIKYNNKLNQLKKTNKVLQGQIEVLQQQQKVSTEKIQSLFHLLKYKKTNVVNKKVLRVEEGDKLAKKAYANAKSFLMIGEYSKAIELFTAYLGLYPNNSHASDAHYWLAKSYLAKEDYRAAKKVFIEFQRENELHHKFANSLYELAKAYTELNQNAKAKLLINTMIKKFPEHAAIFKAKALLKILQKLSSPEPVKAAPVLKISTPNPVSIKVKTNITTAPVKPTKISVDTPTIEPVKAKTKAE